MNSLLLLSLLLHPLHTTHTTITLGPGDGCTLEIRAFTDDLHAALQRRGSGITDSTIAQYVRATVAMTDRAGRPASFHWIGRSPDGDVTRLQLSCVLPAGGDGISLQQSMQTELYNDQVNVVQIRMPARRISLLFTPGDMAKPVS